MKIVFFRFDLAHMGGVEKIFTEKMNYLADIAGHDVFFITVIQGSHPLYYALSPKVKHIDLGINSHTRYQAPIYKRLFLEYKYNKKIKNRFQELITTISPDIITTIASKENSFILDIKTKAKRIMESHAAKTHATIEYNDFYPIRILKKIIFQNAIRKIEKKSDAIVTLTTDDAKAWNAKTVVVIPNIVDLHNHSHSTLTNKIALFAGRFSYQKGLERMLEAWKIITKTHNDWELKLTGQGEQKEELKKMCIGLSIENNVIFAETTKKIIEEYHNASIFLLTSRYEGFGLVLVEAMQCGVPCVSFDCPYGPADIIDNGKNGILVENGNIEDFANAVLELIENEELRMKMGKAAIEKAKEYLPERIMPKWIELFHELNKS